MYAGFQVVVKICMLTFAKKANFNVSFEILEFECMGENIFSNIGTPTGYSIGGTLVSVCVWVLV